MKTWEMVKEITENPNKKFKSMVTGELVELEFTGIRIVNSKINCMLHVDDEWEEINKIKESVKVKRMCECPNCKTLSPKVNENYEDIKAEGFDCPNCGAEFMTPINSSLIVEVSE